MILMLLSVNGGAQGPPDLPPLPTGHMETALLFVGERVSAAITPEQSIQTYVFPVVAQEVIAIEMWRESSDLVPFIRLRNTQGQVLFEQAAQDLAGRRAAIQYRAPIDDWYIVEATFDPASESYGTFSLTLQQTTPVLYQLLAAQIPPPDPNIIYMTRSTGAPISAEDSQVFAIFLDNGETLNAAVTPAEIRTQLVASDSAGGVLGESANGALVYNADSALWVLLTANGGDNQALILDVQIAAQAAPDIYLVAFHLGDFLRATPTPTNTATPTATPTPLPTSTRTPSLTATQIPTPESCPGTQPSRLKAGDRARVTPGTPNRLRSDPSVNAHIVDRIAGGHQFTVLAGPVCADGYAWFEVDYGSTIGWTAEGDSRVYWLEPLRGG